MSVLAKAETLGPPVGAKTTVLPASSNETQRPGNSEPVLDLWGGRGQEDVLVAALLRELQSRERTLAALLARAATSAHFPLSADRPLAQLPMKPTISSPSYDEL